MLKISPIEKSLDKKNIIFLDFDGVLQPYNSKERFNHNLEEDIDNLCKKYNNEIYKNMDKYDIGAVLYDWNLTALNLLKILLIETNSYIVFSTDWRDFNSFEKLKALLKIHNLDEKCINVCDKGNKKEAIKNYIEKHKDEIKNYIVLDDKDFSDAFGKNYVKSINYFKRNDFEIARCILEGKDPKEDLKLTYTEY